MTETARGTSPILASFDLERTGDASFVGESVFEEGRPVVFGGQIMGQMIVAASRMDPAKRVRSLHLVFARAGNAQLPVEIELSSVHSGRSFGTTSATASQQGRVLSQGLALMDTGDAGVIHHQLPRSDADGPGKAPLAPHQEVGVEVRIVDGVDLMTTEATGSPEVSVWVRFLDVPDDSSLHQALLAWYTDSFLIAAAMRPHEGVGQEQAHKTLSTGVIAHTLTFHEAVRADQWMLLANRSLYAGHGRTYGEGHVFTEDGTLVASFVQENMVRMAPDARSASLDRTRAI